MFTVYSVVMDNEKHTQFYHVVTVNNEPDAIAVRDKLAEEFKDSNIMFGCCKGGC